MHTRSLNLSLQLSTLLITLFVTLTSHAFAADETDPEVEYLLNAVGTSGCVFVRNGKEHAADAAEDHLRMKYNKTRRYIDTADEFIEKLASESSWTGKPYLIACPDAETVPSREWLTSRLSEYREAANR